MSSGAQRDASSEPMGVLVRGTAINVGARAYNFVGRLIFNLLLARLLGPDHLGIYFVALTTAGALGVLIVAGLDGTLVRYLSCYRSDQNWGAHRGTLRFAVCVASLLGLVGFLALVLGAPWIATVIFHRPALIGPLRIMALYGPLFGLMSVFLAATQSFNEMKYKALIASIIDPTLRIGVVTGALLLGGGLNTVLIGSISSTLICTVLAWFALGRCLPTGFSNYIPTVERGELLRYGMPLFGAEILGFLIVYVDSLILGHFRPFQEVGLYSICLRLMLLSGSALPLAEQAFAPMISELHHRGELTKLGTYCKVVTLWVVQAYIPIMLLFLVVPRQILALFGKGFEVAVPALVILAFAHLVDIMTGPISLMLNMSGWSRLEMWNTGSVLILQVLLAILLVPQLGFLGAAIADGAALVGVNLIRLVQLRLRLGIYPLSLTMGKPLVAGVVALGAAVPFWLKQTPAQPFQVALVLTAMLVAYVGMLAAFGLDHYSRVAWQELRTSFGRILSQTPSTTSLEREIE